MGLMKRVRKVAGTVDSATGAVKGAVADTARAADRKVESATRKVASRVPGYGSADAAKRKSIAKRSFTKVRSVLNKGDD